MSRSIWRSSIKFLKLLKDMPPKVIELDVRDFIIFVALVVVVFASASVAFDIHAMRMDLMNEAVTIRTGLFDRLDQATKRLDTLNTTGQVLVNRMDSNVTNLRREVTQAAGEQKQDVKDAIKASSEAVTKSLNKQTDALSDAVEKPPVVIHETPKTELAQPPLLVPVQPGPLPPGETLPTAPEPAEKKQGFFGKLKHVFGGGGDGKKPK